MTPDLITDPASKPNEPPSTAGMTTKVVKGSIWTLAGQVAPLAVSLVTTPFVIRMLGAEGYGVLVLVFLLPTYLSFADLGMSIASTKFASEAYGHGDHRKEARVVRTAGFIALSLSTPIAAALFILSGWVVTILGVPDHLIENSTRALQFTAIAFVLNLLGAIFNTPQLTRLRMELNTLVTAGFRVVGVVATPIALYLGGSIATVSVILMLTGLLTLVAHLIVSRHLLPYLLDLGIDWAAIWPMVRYGANLAGASLAGVVLLNMEKLVLLRTTSIEALAYYSIAFTFAMMMTTLSASMTQSLIPAFAQLLDPAKRVQLENLFSRALRINLVVMLPLLLAMLVAARPFFTLWAGENFGRESTLPFYILLLGIVFAINNYAPVSLLMASGRTDMLATVYWVEIIPYLGLVLVLASRFGAVGAAAAWTIRVIVDTVIFSWLASRHTGIRYQIPGGNWRNLSILIGLLVPLVGLALFSALTYLLFVLFPFALVGYAMLAWHKLLASEERVWLLKRLRLRFG